MNKRSYDGLKASLAMVEKGMKGLDSAENIMLFSAFWSLKGYIEGLGEMVIPDPQYQQLVESILQEQPPQSGSFHATKFGKNQG